MRLVTRGSTPSERAVAACLTLGRYAEGIRYRFGTC
jgi:hypothetical protein